MCYRLAISHPMRHRLPPAEVLALRELRLADVPEGVEVLSVELGGCACGLVWDERADSTPTKMARWRKKGWSEAKIQRALDARTHARAHSHAERPAFEAWLVDAVRSTPGLRVLVSEYGEAEPPPGHAADARCGVSMPPDIAHSMIEVHPHPNGRGGWF